MDALEVVPIGHFGGLFRMETGVSIAFEIFLELYKIIDDERKADALEELIHYQQAQFDLTIRLGGQLQQLLLVDVKAARSHLEIAKLPGRRSKEVHDDIVKARDYLIRALGSASSENVFDTLPGIEIKKDIALCSLMLGDYSVAEYYLQAAISDLKSANAHLEQKIQIYYMVMRMGLYGGFVKRSESLPISYHFKVPDYVKQSSERRAKPLVEMRAALETLARQIESIQEIVIPVIGANCKQQ